MSKKWHFAFGIIIVIASNLLQGHASDTGQSKTNTKNGLLAEPAEAPSSIIGRIASFPVSIAGGLLNRVKQMITRLFGVATSQIWNIIKNFVIPGLDKILMRIASTNAIPQNLNDMISEAHSGYELIKFFGYMKPA